MNSDYYERGRKLNYFAACSSRLRKILKWCGYKVSEAQIRLIMKDLSNIDGFEEMEFGRQKKLFISVASKYVRVSERTIELAIRQTEQRKKKRRRNPQPDHPEGTKFKYQKILEEKTIFAPSITPSAKKIK